MDGNFSFEALLENSKIKKKRGGFAIFWFIDVS